jgi:hypothetical protein
MPKRRYAIPTESRFFQLIREARDAIGKQCFLRRVENGIGDGTPDVFAKTPISTAIWIELKTVREPVNSTSILFGTRARGLDLSQENWLEEYCCQFNGTAYVAICTDYRLLLIHGRYAKEINEMRLGALVYMAKHHSFRCESKWKDFFECM